MEHRPVSDPPNQPVEPADSVPTAGRRARRRWQVGLRTLFLLMAVFAVWMAYFINRRQNARLEARIKTMIPLAHELVVEDPRQVAAVKLEEYWYDENRWDLYLPAGRYRLCLATRSIDDKGFASASKNVAIADGRHRLTLEQRLDKDVWRLAVTCDDAALLSVEEPKEWNAERGSSSEGHFGVSEQVPADRPVVLFRRRFMKPSGQGSSSTSAGPSEGLLLWIEPESGPDAGR
jgi:hypothetical protein